MITTPEVYVSTSLCLSFWYYASAEDTDTLSVYTTTRENKQGKLMEIKGEWNYNEIICLLILNLMSIMFRILNDEAWLLINC